MKNNKETIQNGSVEKRERWQEVKSEIKACGVLIPWMAQLLLNEIGNHLKVLHKGVAKLTWLNLFTRIILDAMLRVCLSLLGCFSKIS